MKQKTLVSAISAVLLLSGCAAINLHQSTDERQANKFRSVIDRTGSPEYMRDYDFDDHQRFNPFFDLGCMALATSLPDNAEGMGDFQVQRC